MVTDTRFFYFVLMKFVLPSFLVLCQITLVAQEKKDTTYVNPKNFLLEEMVISANRWEQNLREVPNRISKVSASLIQFQNPQTAADLLGASNQVFIQKSQLGGGSPMIRGFATNRVLLVVDGVRMNNAIFRGGNVQNVISLDANTVEDAEVIFGPGSVVYGSDAIGGVMDFHTITPKFSETEKPSLTINGLSRYASANTEFTNHIDLNVGFKKWALVSSYTHSYFDDLRMGSHGPKDYLRPDYQSRVDGVDEAILNKQPEEQIRSGYSQDNFLQKLLFQPNENISLQYSLQYSKTSNVPRYDRLILKKDDDTFASAEWYYGPQKWIIQSLQASFNKSISVWDHARITVAYQDYEESRHNRNFNSPNRTNRFEEVNAFSINLDADKVIKRTTLFYGVEFLTNKVGSTAYRKNILDGSTSPTTTRYPDGSTWQTMAAYISAKQKISDKFLLNASARVSNSKTEAEFDPSVFPFSEANVDNTALNGSIGVVFTPSVDWKWYANFSSGFRSPNVDDIGKVFDSQPGDVVVPNPDLHPEYAYSGELGLVGIVGNFTFDLATYYTILDNAIARDRDTFNGEDSIVYDGVLSRVLSQQNISSVKIGGIQVGLNWKPSEKWLVTSSLSWQKGEETYPDSTQTYSPTHVAPLFGATHIIFTTQKIKMDLYANYNGAIDYDKLALSERADKHLYAKDENGNPYAPSWVTMNFKLSYNVSKFITLDAGLENIFDARYRPYASGISAPGRNAIVALRIII